MLLRRYLSEILFPFGLVLIAIPHLVQSKPDAASKTSKDITLSNQSDESKSDTPPSPPVPAAKSAPNVLLASNSDKVVKRATKAGNNIAEIIRGEEKLKTSAATAPFGFAANGILGEFNSPHPGGVYAGGIQPGYAPVQPGYATGYSGFLGRNPGQHLLNGGQPGIVGPGYAGGHHGGHLGGPGVSYGGVVYAGHGNGLGFGQEHVTVNKQTEVGIGPYGVDQRRDIIQKSVNRVQGGGVGIATPINYYGNRGVVYMGHGEGGIIPGGHLDHQYQHGHQGRQFGAYDGVGGIGFHNPIDVNLNRVNPYHQGVPVHHDSRHGVGAVAHGVGGYGGPVSGGYGGPVSGGYGGPVSGGYGGPVSGGYGGPGGYQQQGVSINKQSEVGVDPYGRVHSNFNVQKTAVTTDGLGYNGVQNNVIAHTDQAYIGPTAYGGHGTHLENRGNFAGPGGYDPYANHLDHLYNGHGGHQSRLLSTGPNRFYQGANPAGVYNNERERYHRFG